MKAANSNNRLVRSPYYAEILTEYNSRFSRDGKVIKSKFFREVVQPRIKNFSYSAFCQFIARFETQAGIEAAAIIDRTTRSAVAPLEAETKVITVLKDSAIATREGIARALNIGMDALQEIIEHPELLSPKDRAQLLFAAMKAQDSRMNAAAKIRHDQREQVKFNKMFNRAAYAGETDSS